MFNPQTMRTHVTALSPALHPEYNVSFCLSNAGPLWQLRVHNSYTAQEPWTYGTMVFSSPRHSCYRALIHQTNLSRDNIQFT